jgi:hypothetical protein
MLSNKNSFNLLYDTDDSDNEIKNDLIMNNNLNSSIDEDMNPYDDTIYEQNCNKIDEIKKTNEIHTINENDIINQIIFPLRRRILIRIPSSTIITRCP